MKTAISGLPRFAALGVVIVAVIVTAALAGQPKTVPFKYAGGGEMLPPFTEAFGAGVGSHIGLYTSHIYNDENGGWEELTAANKDTVLAKMQKVIVYPDESNENLLVFEYEAEIVGGSGRFQHATGYYSGKFVLDLTTFSGTAEAAGYITTVGSTK